jgi:hypothetical protein
MWAKRRRMPAQAAPSRFAGFSTRKARDIAADEADFAAEEVASPSKRTKLDEQQPEQGMAQGKEAAPAQGPAEPAANSEATLAGWSSGAGMPQATNSAAAVEPFQSASSAAQESVGENSMAPALDLGEVTTLPGVPPVCVRCKTLLT